MSTGLGFLEVIFVFGVGLALAVWELVRIRRDLRQSRDRHNEKPRGDTGS